MIDYLERLFLQEEHQWEGEEDGSSPSPLRMEDEPQRPEELGRQEVLWQLEQALSVPEAGKGRLASEQVQPMPRPGLSRETPALENYPVPEIYRSREQDGSQELEHRLRRNSRRYDSGFFLY